MRWFAAWAASPVRFLLAGVIFVLLVASLAVIGYTSLGWSLGDAIYMVVVTIFTVGYEEVHAVDSIALRTITELLIVFGCTGMIFLTGALVQVVTLAQVQLVFGQKRMSRQIEALRGHVIICGFGRIGLMLARELNAAQTGLVVIEANAERAQEVREMGFLCLHADAADEQALEQAGIQHARAVAAVVPSDAANIFITLSARGLNPTVQIIARGVQPSTEKKLLQAGANSVVMPTHIGAEQVASLILFPAISDLIQSSDRRRRMERDLQALGLELQVVRVDEASLFANHSVAEIEHQAAGQFFIVAIERKDSRQVERPTQDTLLHAGDGITVLTRAGHGELVRHFGAAEASV